MSLLTPEITAHLTTLYSSPSRHYHNLSHVESLLALLNEYRFHFQDAPAAEAAIWFHDAIYDPQTLKGDQNELQSAELAGEMLTAAGVNTEQVERVTEMIEATATHVLPCRFSEADIDTQGEARDVALFLDMDLSILGAEKLEYEWYEGMVRREYNWVGDHEWRVGRADDIEKEKEQKFIYHTDLFRGLFEDQARRNMRSSLDMLEGLPLYQ
ncbi:hypothetical protein QBC37DRAFT_322131 [Rhypophila decipiens]|uniref:HD domain-containing protein n=1 Tax=Rhypophila decipiens TaxID=261697 RepID=A0AAN6Y6R0_9PEZI|nr:hypothetical protein QBC37DRAFT_322131 [Rhypophila decipiens]